MRVFVIGGTGFVGSAFVRHCSAAGIPCEVIGRENYQDFVGRTCSVLINANGNSKKYLSEKDPVADFDASVRSVYRSLRDFRCDTYVLCSSCDVYPDPSRPSSTSETTPLAGQAMSRYGFHKFLAEEVVRHETASHLILRFGGFVGPGLRKNAVYDILTGGPLWLDPESRLQFLHTDEAARIVFSLVAAGRLGETFNVCGSGLVRLADLIREVGPVAVRPESPRVEYHVDIAKLQQCTTVPSSCDAVRDFIRTWQGRSAS